MTPVSPLSTQVPTDLASGSPDSPSPRNRSECFVFQSQNPSLHVKDLKLEPIYFNILEYNWKHPLICSSLGFHLNQFQICLESI